MNLSQRVVRNLAGEQTKKIMVFIVDDHPILRKGLAQLIHNESNFIVSGQAENSKETFEALKSHVPDVMIMDLSLKNENGLDVIKQLKIHYPAIAILVVSMYDEEFYAERALHAGAMGYVMKTQATDLILIALQHILKGEIYLSESASAKILRKISKGSDSSQGPISDKLSDRELQVFRLIGKGMGTRQIAEKISRSVKTIETYREHIKQKMDLKDAGELAQAAIQWMQNEP